MFEVISAFGTVGLTMDLTSEYNGLTELIIVIVMLFGKVGLLTMARAFIPPRSPRKYHYSKGHIHIYNKASSMKNREGLYLYQKQNDFLVILKAWSVTPFSSIIPQISLYHQ